ncbi:MAG: universal stress protein [Proteobacteria bacterium]|nr:MAG: universal stress protein [Pseudomonadota bacterium]
MTYKTILLHIDSGKCCPVRVEIAAQLALRFDAHLIGLYAMTTGHSAASRLFVTGPEIVEQQRQVATEQARQAQALFDGAAQRGGLAKAEWRVSSDDALTALTMQARYADLVMIGQSEPWVDSGVDNAFARRAVLAAGRPVLVVPYIAGASTIGKNILLAWNASREATRATTDALPFLRSADAVAVVAVKPRGKSHGEVPGVDIGPYLARHGVSVKTSTVEAEEADVATLLLSHAADLSSDLIVMGAYGHSRFSELVLGGATRTMLESMTVPVLMSH